LTYNGHPLGCATAKATLEVYQQDNLIENSATLGEVLASRLEEFKMKYNIIGDARNKGLYGSIELVNNRETKEPLTASIANTMKARLMKKGLSTLVKGHIIFVGPPLIVSKEELLEGLNIIEELLKELSSEL